MTDEMKKKIEIVKRRPVSKLFNYGLLPNKEEIHQEIDKLFNRLENQQQRIEELRQQVEDKEHNDKRLVEAEAKIKELRDEMYDAFKIPSWEQESLREKQKAHVEEAHGGLAEVGAIGGRWTYHFTPTGIGCFYSCTCSCGFKIEGENDF